MRAASALLALGAVASAQQVPLADQLKGWYSAASSAVTSYGSMATSAVGAFGAVASSSASSVKASMPSNIPDARAAAASAVAAGLATPLTVQNYKEVLSPGAATASPGVEEFMVYVTGGNKTCMGFCGRADEEWAKAAPTLNAIPGAPHLASLDCETDGVLCHAWGASPPSILYIRRPQPLADQSSPATEVRYINLNRTSITSPTISGLYSNGAYKEAPIYEGFFHPFNGPLAESGANIALGYAIWAFSKIPSWLFMVSISMFSRSFMSRRMQPGRPAGAPAAAPAAAR